MKSRNSAFVTVKVKCPICERESQQRYVKSKLYTPQQVEADNHVVAYKWESPRYAGIRPNFYHIWHCPHCHFCDEREVFRGEDNSGGKLELIREKLLIAARAPGSFITRMGSEIDLEREYITLEAALCAHLQATYIQEMLSPNMRQYHKLGKFYLRTAWLYREKRTWDVPEAGTPGNRNSYEEFFRDLRDEWPDLPLCEDEALDKAIFNYRASLDRSRRVDDVRYQITVTFLLAELNRRRENYDESLQCLRGVFQNATRKRQATRHALDSGISKGKGTQQQIESMRSLITWLNNAIERATTCTEEINTLIFKQEYQHARALVLAMDHPSPQAVWEKLRNEGMHEITCKRVATLFKKQVMSANLDEAQAAESEQARARKQARESGFWKNIYGKIVGGNKDG